MMKEKLGDLSGCKTAAQLEEEGSFPNLFGKRNNQSEVSGHGRKERLGGRETGESVGGSNKTTIKTQLR